MRRNSFILSAKFLVLRFSLTVRSIEKLSGIEILTLTVSSEDAKAVLREALAMGADKAYLVNDPAVQGVDTSGTAYILAQAVKKIGEFDLILCGEASLDSFSGLVGSRLSSCFCLSLGLWIEIGNF